MRQEFEKICTEIYNEKFEGKTTQHGYDYIILIGILKREIHGLIQKLKL